MNDSEGVRLQKVLAAAGVASRRAAENLIDRGRVEVDGEVVRNQGMRVDPRTAVIRVDGVRIPPPREHRYLALNKPRGVLSAMADPQGRPTLVDFVPAGERLFHVGRLDADTEGLLLLTNDGDMAQRLMHPSFEVVKTYLADVAGALTDATAKKLRAGIDLDDGPITPDSVKVVQRSGGHTLVEVRLHSGRNRIVRRMFDAVGHPVQRLSRLSVGPVRLGDLRSGQTRELTDAELGSLLDLLQR
jgi:23S rRNA pseudouridine2605 synthase